MNHANKILILASFFALSSCAGDKKMGPIANFSSEEFKRNGTLPAAAKVEQKDDSKPGFLGRIFNSEKKVDPKAPAPPLKLATSTAKKAPTSPKVAQVTKPKPLLPSSGESELRLPDMLNMPDESAFRPSMGTSIDRKAPIIARPPAE